jgi:hypothetical protein
MRLIRNNAIAITALVFAFTGTGLAASHYVITSTKQIKPKVLKKLHGARGARGVPGKEGTPGKEGPQGKQGVEGKQGPAGPFPTTLPKGVTLTGVYNAEGSATGAHAFAGDSISFNYPLATAPQSQVIREKEPPTTECPGSPSEPKATPGWLCVYEAEGENAETVKLGLVTDPYTRFGNFVSVKSKEAGEFFSTGSWAVTGD